MHKSVCLSTVKRTKQETVGFSIQYAYIKASKVSLVEFDFKVIYFEKHHIRMF